VCAFHLTWIAWPYLVYPRLVALGTQGRSYKVIPQIKRADRLTPDQLSNIYITGSSPSRAPTSGYGHSTSDAGEPARRLVPLSTFATARAAA
jgi:multidrug efflux pump subunit AcrB